MTASFILAMAAPSQGAPSALVQLLPFALVLAIFYFIILLPMKRRQQKVADFLSSLKVGDQVVQIQIAERVRVDISRNAVVGYQGQEPIAPEGSGTSS